MDRSLVVSSVLVLALACGGDNGDDDGSPGDGAADDGASDGGGSDGGADDGGATGDDGSSGDGGGSGGDGGSSGDDGGSSGDDGGSSGDDGSSGGTDTTGDAGTSGGEGCGSPTTYASGANELTIDVGGQQRTFILAMPGGYDENTAYPLVFALHGRTGDGALARLYFGIEQEAAGQAIFLYPDGLPVMGGDTGWDLTGAQDVDLFDALVDRFSRELCIDANRIFATGHSFGGYFSNHLGCQRGDVLRAIAPVAGGGPWGSCSGEVAAWIAHGTNDDVVELSQGQGSRDHWTAASSCDATSQGTAPSPCVAYDGCDAGHPVHWCEHPGEHEWPDFAAAGIWGFFASF